MSLLSIVASSSAFRLPASPPPKGSSIDSDWSTKNKKQPGFLRLISAWYAIVSSLFVALRAGTHASGLVERQKPHRHAATGHRPSTRRIGAGCWDGSQRSSGIREHPTA